LRVFLLIFSDFQDEFWLYKKVALHILGFDINSFTEPLVTSLARCCPWLKSRDNVSDCGKEAGHH
jgi:hypothetical protein